MGEQQNPFRDTFLAVVSDQMDTSFYMTDVEMDKIPYMSKAMKRTFRLIGPEDRVCWRVLRKDTKE